MNNRTKKSILKKKKDLQAKLVKSKEVKENFKSEEQNGSPNEVMNVIWITVQVVSNAITILGGLDTLYNATLKAGICNFVTELTNRLRLAPVDEQIVQAGKLIVFLRAINSGLNLPSVIVNKIKAETFSLEDLECIIDMEVSSKDPYFDHLLDALNAKWAKETMKDIVDKNKGGV